MIQKEDVQRVAKELNIKVSDERIKEILRDYPENQQNYSKEDNWTLIVEDMLYE